MKQAVIEENRKKYLLLENGYRLSHFFVYSMNGTNAAMFPSSSTNSTSLKAAGA